jgi:hypothetical protein
MAMPKKSTKRPVTLRHTATDLKVAEARQATARADVATGRASVARGRVAIARGRAILRRRAKAGEPASWLAPIRVTIDAAEADLNAAEVKLNAAAARIEVAERGLNEARKKARRVDRRPPPAR